jgi:hypothetical protein
MHINRKQNCIRMYQFELGVFERMVEKEPIKKIVGSQGNLEKQKWQVSSFVQACNESS